MDLTPDKLGQIPDPIETEIQFNIHSQAANSELRDEDSEFDEYDRIIRKEIETADDLNDFLNRLETRKNEMESSKAVKLDVRLTKILRDSPDYKPETVQILDDIRKFDWDRIDNILEDTENLDAQEQMYIDWIKTQSKKRPPEELADFALNHYREKKRERPERVESFESAMRKTFGRADIHPYQNVLEEVELLTGPGYHVELQRIIKEELQEDIPKPRKKAYDDILDALKVSESPAELAAYTQDKIEFLDGRRPEIKQHMIDIVEEEYEAALPTTPVYQSK